jgi:hypothetical protein
LLDVAEAYQQRGLRVTAGEVAELLLVGSAGI